MAQLYDARERTPLACTDNTTIVWWQQKVFATPTSPLASLLRLQAMH